MTPRPKRIGCREFYGGIIRFLAWAARTSGVRPSDAAARPRGGVAGVTGGVAASTEGMVEISRLNALTVACARVFEPTTGNESPELLI